MTIRELAEVLGAEPESRELDQERYVMGVAAPELAGAREVVFAQDEAALLRACMSGAGAILADITLRGGTSDDGDLRRVLWVEDARMAFALAARALRRRMETSEIAASADIAADAKLGQRLRIGPGVVIESDVVVGDECELAARVVICSGTTLGARVIVKAGAVLGSAGFGFVRDRVTGSYVPFPQQGRLRIEDDVSIGANTTIDRGALDETVIGAGSKIDNLVHIAHNCRVGRDVVIAAQTGIAGSSTIGNGAVLAGQVGIADHVTIGEGVVVGAKAGVPSNKHLQGAGQVFWGIPARPIQQYLRELARLKRGR